MMKMGSQTVFVLSQTVFSGLKIDIPKLLGLGPSILGQKKLLQIEISPLLDTKSKLF